MLKRDLPDKTPAVMVDGNCQPIKGGVDLSVEKHALNSFLSKKLSFKYDQMVNLGLVGYWFEIAPALPPSLHLAIN